MDERSKLRALLKACHRLTKQLEKLPANEHNWFAANWIRETCDGLQNRLRKLESRRGPSDRTGQP